MSADASETVQDRARRVLDIIDRSGYGTNRPDRYTPTFSLDEVKALAEFVVAHG